MGPFVRFCACFRPCGYGYELGAQLAAPWLCPSPAEELEGPVQAFVQVIEPLTTLSSSFLTTLGFTYSAYTLQYVATCSG